eukprot:GILJ01000655.1.p1 GENE.GILJ01000655.1~~GILJ01000655.1.p1  ORF type:complete len:363 (-),score=44.40 GILJ01000655.1:158-1246(-)
MSWCLSVLRRSAHLYPSRVGFNGVQIGSVGAFRHFAEKAGGDKGKAAAKDKPAEKTPPAKPAAAAAPAAKAKSAKAPLVMTDEAIAERMMKRVTVHEGYRVCTSLLIDRWPLQLTVPEYEKKFREIQHEYRKKTNRYWDIPEELRDKAKRASYETPDASERSAAASEEAEESEGAHAADATTDEFESQFSSGLFSDPRLADFMTDHLEQTQTETTSTTDEGAPLRSANRLPEDRLFLILKKRSTDKSPLSWMLPHTVRYEGESMRSANERLVTEDIGFKMRVWFVGYPPIAHFTYDFTPERQKKEGVQGLKVFCYLAHFLNGKVDLMRPNADTIDYAWVSKEELANHMHPIIHEQITDGIPW